MRRACLAATALLLMMSMVLGTSGVRAAEAESELPRNMLDPFFEAVWRFDDWMQYEIAEAKRLEAERIEQERLRRIAGMQLKEAWGRLSQITEETPWLIRVNQNTCTVTVYRVLEIKESDIVAESNTDTGSAASQTLYVPVYACPCSVGADGGTPDGVFYIQDHLRWHELIGPSWGQWCCHFAPSYLFHSLPYNIPQDPNSMWDDVYNLIGRPASHGCVRLVAKDAKYIFDHAPTGATVEIFHGTPEDDPLGTPERPYVGEWDKHYDPTDPEYVPEE